ncbi:hypothetical protein CAL29_22690 [Bordetella genomosp. 10]|uniref:HTH marR-type domain-containing protein n=1 Tax=Bordetella genomosp. 10 TaxID=1416804 RepID=A0A261S2T5_9BORD|nr:hypothetical protein CAL29_22690 [Bordetella genomosp. 10]
MTAAVQPARRAWVGAATTVLSHYGFSMSLGLVVLYLKRHGGSAQQKLLAEEIGINAAAMVRVLDQGEEMGVLLRTEHKDNRRSKSVVLSPEGDALAQELGDAMQQLRAELLSDIPVGEIDIAVKVLRRLQASAQAYSDSKART